MIKLLSNIHNSIKNASLRCFLIGVCIFFIPIFLRNLKVVFDCRDWFVFTSFIFVTISFVLCIYSFISYHATKDKDVNMGIATWTIVCSLLYFLLFFLGLDYLHSTKSTRDTCRRATLFGLARYVHDYSNVNNGKLPDADSWTDDLIELEELSFLVDPKYLYQREKEHRCYYAFNKNLSGLKIDELPNDIVLFFQAKGDLNLSGSHDLIDSWQGESDYIYVILLNDKIQKYWYDISKCKEKPGGQYDNVETLRWVP